MEYHCPECGATLVTLTTHGHCPSCLFPLSSKYLAIDGEEWLEHTTDDEQRGEIIRRLLPLVYSLVWVDLKYTGIVYKELEQDT